MDKKLIDHIIIDNLRSFQNLHARSLSLDLEKYNNTVNLDPELAIILGRRILDHIIRSTCSIGNIVAGTKPLENLLSELIKLKILPTLIERHCRIVKDFGNLAVHGLSDETSIVDNYKISNVEVELCTQSLSIILRWYSSQVLPQIVSIPSFLILNRNEVTAERLEETALLDTKVYPKEFCGIPEIMKSWHKHNNDIYTLLIDSNTDKVVGCITAIPLYTEIFFHIESGEFNDAHIPVSAIRTYDFPDFYKLHIASVEIDPGYQGTHIFKVLFDAFLDKLLFLCQRDIYISEVLADAITDQGAHLCELVGMKKIRQTEHNSFIFKGTLIPPSLRIFTNKGKNLLSFYSRKYEEVRELFNS